MRDDKTLAGVSETFNLDTAENQPGKKAGKDTLDTFYPPIFRNIKQAHTERTRKTSPVCLRNGAGERAVRGQLQVGKAKQVDERGCKQWELDKLPGLRRDQQCVEEGTLSLKSAYRLVKTSEVAYGWWNRMTH